MADHLEGFQVSVHQREGILHSLKVVQGNVDLAVKALERVEDMHGGVAGRVRETAGRSVRMKKLRLEIESTRRGFELRLVKGGGKIAAL